MREDSSPEILRIAMDTVVSPSRERRVVDEAPAATQAESPAIQRLSRRKLTRPTSLIELRRHTFLEGSIAGTKADKERLLALEAAARGVSVNLGELVWEWVLHTIYPLSIPFTLGKTGRKQLTGRQFVRWAAEGNVANAFLTHSHTHVNRW